mmetsp:Transcript_17927/g.51377  ORF Transcript_17927/g.51377 Transcript_17927/m.51377 type:complete len:137 (+) Transcript_17927:245-655(+)
MPSSRCSSPNPEDVIRLEDLIKQCPGAPKRKKRRPRGESGGGAGSGGTISFEPMRGDGHSRGGEAGGGREEDERTPPESSTGRSIRPQQLFHDESEENNDNACTELRVSRILALSTPSGSVSRAAPQDAAEQTRDR